MLLLLSMVGCERVVLVGAECLVLSEVVTSPNDWVFRPDDGCRFEVSPPPPEAAGDDPDFEFRVDWVEVCNPTELQLVTDAYVLHTHPDDNPYAPDPIELPPSDLYPGDCLVIVGKPKFYGLCPDVQQFDLDQQLGTSLLLESRDEGCSDVAEFDEALPLGTSWARVRDRWGPSDEPWPGEAVLK